MQKWIFFPPPLLSFIMQTLFQNQTPEEEQREEGLRA